MPELLTFLPSSWNQSQGREVVRWQRRDTKTSPQVLQVKRESLHTSCSALTAEKRRSQPSPEGSPSPEREKHPDLWKATFSPSKSQLMNNQQFMYHEKHWVHRSPVSTLWLRTALLNAGREQEQTRYQLRKIQRKRQKKLDMIQCCCPSLKVSSKASEYLSRSSETES